MSAPVAFTLIDEGAASDVHALVVPEGIRLHRDAVRASLGWELKPEGLCRGDTCVPVRPEHGLVHPDGIDLATLASLLDRPLALDADERVACLGASAAERRARLRSLDAPDFTLPDLDARPHRFADQRGRKVLLLAWASW
jgi:hypothetical protein